MNRTGLGNTLKRVVQAGLTNQIARYAPAFYVRLTGQTGRGAGEDHLGNVSDYFQTCFDDYFKQLGIDHADQSAYLNGKRILEYGPGDLPGVAMLMIAHGADQIVCVDRFPLIKMSSKNVGITQIMLERLSPSQRNRAESCFRQAGHPESCLDPRRITYLVRPNGVSGMVNEVDMVISRAVLEHVNDLSASFHDMYAALKPGGIALHLVDLKSHGLHRENPLDFLNWPTWLWSLMYSAKGVPNRLRANAYRDVVTECGFELVSMTPTLRASPDDIRDVRPELAKPFRDLSDDDLSWLGFWLMCRKPMVH